MTQTFQPWWAGPRLPLLVVFAVAVLLNIPYLGGGFVADDILFLDVLEMDPRPFTWWGGLWSERDPPTFDWTDFASFRALWWLEAETMGTFWRPLFSWIFAGSVFLLGENAVPLHALSLIVHGAVCVCLVLLVRRLSGRAGLALLAGLLYAACEDHSLGVGWISTMTDLLCVLSIMLALLGHLRWLRTREGWALAVSLLALAFAFMSKESAVTAPVVMVLLTLVAPRGEAEDIEWSGGALRARAVHAIRDLPSWLPQTAALVLYLVLYKALGFGGMDNLMYLDPLGNPVAYLRNAALHGPVMWLATLSPVPPSTVMFVPESLGLLVAAGVVIFAVWLALLWPHRRSGLALWALGSYLVALMPQLTTDASERGLYFPFIGAAILLGLILARLRSAGPWLHRLAAWAVLLGIAVPGAFMSLTMPYSMMGSFSALDDQIGTALPHLRERQPKETLVLNTSGMMVTFYVGGILESEIGKRVDLRLLSSCNAVVSLERTGEDSFTLRADRPGWLSNIFARAVRKEPRFAVGRRYDNPHFEATVLEVTADAADVLAVSFELKSFGPETLLLRWDGERFEPFDLAALPVGRSIVLADTSDVWASL